MIMKGLKPVVFLILTISLFAIGLRAQEPAIDTGVKASGGVVSNDDAKGPADDATVKDSPNSLTAISSTATGGLWSSPSTWAGGVVPGPSDDVTIVSGAAVVIDTAAFAGNLTVGSGGGFMPAILTFYPLSTKRLTVSGNLTIQGAADLFTTPDTGTITDHEINIGGNLTNNGVLDLSTNGNQAGANLFFTGASNNTFGGGGSQTNIRTINVNKGMSDTSTLTLSVLNFTVQGSSTDGPASGYLTLTNGTFKISGTFSGNHRTFTTANYTIPPTAGFWLSNANYTVAAQESVAVVEGQLRISAGVYNVGTTANSFIRNGNLGGMITVEGGTVNIAGGMLRSGFPGASYTQSGGTITTCMAGNPGTCFDMAGNGTGGTLVIQTPHSVPNDNAPDFNGGIPGIGGTPATTLQFGNANTPGTGVFVCICGNAPNIAINTASGPHTVKLAGGGAIVRNVNIGAGGTLDIGDTTFYTSGETFVNNGTFKVKPTSVVNLSNPMVQTLPAMTYSGSGSFSGPITRLYIRGPSSVTFDAAVNSIRTRDLQLENSQIINAGKLTVGMNDALPSTVSIRGPGGLDSSPVYDLGSGGQKLIYEVAGNRTMGGELNPSRELIELTHRFSADTVTITGGDVTLNGPLNILSGIIDTGTNKINHLSGVASRLLVPTGGYIRGTLVRKFVSTTDNAGYSFLVGDGHYARVYVQATSLPSGPALVSVTARDVTLAGLPPAASASFSWDLIQTGAMTSILELNYADEDVNGIEDYWMWRSTAHLPMLVPNSTRNSSSNNVEAQGITNLTGSFGVGRKPPPISISGTVLTSGGAGIRNAVVTVTGGNLLVPISVQTGSFGTYLFQNLDPGGEYTVTASAKRNRFSTSSQIVSSMTSVTDVNFIANPQ